VGWLEHTFAVLQKNTNFFAKVFDSWKDDVHNLVSLLHDKQHETKQTSGSPRF
jgi:predicted proteasome-type protease